MIYLDDLIVLFKHNGFVLLRVALLQAILRAFGLTINSDKNRLLPSTWFIHLELTVDLAWQEFDVLDHKRAKLHAVSCSLADYVVSHH